MGETKSLYILNANWWLYFEEKAQYISYIEHGEFSNWRKIVSMPFLYQWYHLTDDCTFSSITSYELNCRIRSIKFNDQDVITIIRLLKSIRYMDMMIQLGSVEAPKTVALICKKWLKSRTVWKNVFPIRKRVANNMFCKSVRKILRGLF